MTLERLKFGGLFLSQKMSRFSETVFYEQMIFIISDFFDFFWGEIWKTRETHLDGVKGFQKFNLIKGSSNDEYTLYASHSVWESKNDFENWVKSEEFRKAHSGAGQHQSIYLSHPEFEGCEVII